MKTEINLRTREFAITREFYWPRLLATLTVILVAVLFLGGSLFVYLYQMQLEVENNYLTQEKASLEARVAPIEEMEAKISDLERREQLAGRLTESVLPWSAHFRAVNGIAEEQGVRTNSLSTTGGEIVRITGDSPSLRRIALFMQALEAAEGSREAVYKYMTMVEEKKFNYEIELVLAPGGDQ